MIERITSTYIHHLQAVFSTIANRGMCVDKEALDAARIFIDTEIQRNLSICSSQWGCHVYVGSANGYDKSHPSYDNQVNVNSSSGERTLLKKLKDLGYKVPPITKRNDEGEYETKYSSGELTLQKMLITNQFGYTGGDPAIRAILQVRELTKLRNSYINARFYQSPDGLLLFLSHYNATGTLTGRRSSKKHTFGYGNNAQNFPKHGKLAKIYRRCIISRPGHIFLMVDQKGAEEWPVNALAENTTALAEMQAGVNRHIRRAARLFNIPEESRTKKEWKDPDNNEYYLGKKTGHANNYGMQPPRLADSLAQEGHSIPIAFCKTLLEKLNVLEPQIRGVFHVYVKRKITSTRILSTPYGRERQFLGLRPNDNNYALFNEAFAYIPQSVVGDNTGFAVNYMESVIPSNDRAIVQENHDSFIQDIIARAEVIWFYLKHAIRSFDRVTRFENGIEINIPVEGELGYNLRDTVEITEMSFDGVVKALAECNEIREKELDEKRQQMNRQKMIDLAASISL